MNSISRLFSLFAAALLMLTCLIFTSACQDEADEGLDVVASVFVPFDFARTIAGDGARVTQLLPPGGEGHDWEPPAKTLREVSRADLFIYVGGGGDKWAEKLLASADVSDAIASGSLRVLCLCDVLDLSCYYGEDAHSQDGHDHNIDTHFWTSTRLARSVADAILNALVALTPDAEAIYRANHAALAESLDALDSELESATVDGGKLYFGDKFAFYYLCRDYGIEYLSPYDGCTDDALPTDRVVVEMKEEVRRESVKIVFCEEYNSSSALAASIASECGAAVRELHSCHNLSKADLEAGLGYIDIMKRNAELIREALAVSVES